MVVLLVILTIALATATFIENDFGSEVARMKVYNSKWLELILLILSVNLIGRVILLKLYTAKKFSIFLFHIALVVMVIGAGVTRYFGYEGSMHIREGESSSTLITSNKTVSLTIDNKNIYQFEANIDQSQKFSSTLNFNNQTIKTHLRKYYTNAYKKAVEIENGKPILGFVVAGNTYRGFEYLSAGESGFYGNISVAFDKNSFADIILSIENDSIYLQSPHPISISNMGGESRTISNSEKTPLEPKIIYRVKESNFIIQEFFNSAEIVAIPTGINEQNRGMSALIFEISNETSSTSLTLWGNNNYTEEAHGMLGDLAIDLSYGNETIELPFDIYLKDFVIDRYPGSSSPSSFSSYVTLNETHQEPVPFHIYMNNILKHKGFRFYQSSYDQDEKGTILSVNNDKWGTLITYIGYFLLTLGIIWSMINSNSFLRKTVIRSSKIVSIAFLIFSTSQIANAQETSAISAKHSEEFGKLLIQNNKGRTEPVYTYASELMRKISRKEEILGLNPVQLFMEMNMNQEKWINEPIIKVSNAELRAYLGFTNKYATYSDFISNTEGYTLQHLVQTSFAKSPGERSKFDKAIIKTDEKVNICYAIFSGRYLKIFPIPNNEENTNWYPSHEASLKTESKEDSIFLTNILPTYFNEVNRSRTSGNYKIANEYLSALINYQRKYAGYELPSEFKTKIEILYYKYNPFKKLFPFYSTIGVLFLFFLIAFIALGKDVPKWVSISFYTIILLAFSVHTLGIVARWYISGHAPMSNGYESMIFISWVTLLAGFLFHKRSPFALTATAVLGGLTLMVANLSFMDPEITNLVPVLQSYWLTIHVSVITASYGFLGLGALLGVINLILIILRTNENNNRIIETLEALTIINHKTLIVGLYLLIIGTFLGAVWANESWGRYWGWDPKETWALISVIVYTIVTHTRLIPGLKGLFTFNALALFGFSTILMTYFGVNYYLSGLHSYAGGDPVPVPSFVYYTIAAVILLTLGASIKFRTMIVPKDDQ